MTLAQMLAAAQERLAQELATRNTAQEALFALRSAENLTEEDVKAATEKRDSAERRVAIARAQVGDLETEIANDTETDEQTTRTEVAAARPTGGARVASEPDVYRQGGQHSYFRDLYHGMVRQNRTSLERLERNDRQTRALNTTDSTGGDFVPPLYLVNQFIELARAGRVVADQIAHQPLPTGTDSIVLPKLATGTAVAEQSTQNSAIQNTDATTASVTAAVTTIAGQQVISQQLMDQSPINMDDILLADLAADYAIKLDTFVINNNAAGKLGLLNVSGAVSVTYTDAGPTVAEVYGRVADAIQQIHTGRFMPPTKIFMHPRRWAWFISALDGSNRPFVVPDGAAQNPLAVQSGVISQGYVGTLQGLPVFVDPNIPTNLSTNQDAIIILRSDDAILFEGTPRSEASIFPGFANLSVTLRFYNYVALQASRYPTGIAKITGTGLTTPNYGTVTP